MLTDLVRELLPAVVAGIGVYAGVKADLRGLHVSVKNAKESADKAHERIDSIFMKGVQ